MAKKTRKVAMPAGIRNKMMAATCMLLVSCIMMVSSTYAWFTLSTAPEVKNISTTVAGNGSLEIALMPASGNVLEIRSGTGTSSESKGQTAVTANTSWGNIVQLSDTSYGLNNIKLVPSVLAASDEGIQLATPIYGGDGRITTLSKIAAALGTYDAANGKFAVNTNYGVRAIGATEGSDFSTYGYVVDLAVRLNTQNGDQPGKLLLQTEAVQRIDGSANAATMGGGSYMQFNTVQPGIDLKGLLDSIRVTFVKNYGKSGTTGSTEAPTVLATACLDTSGISEGPTTLTATGKLAFKLYEISFTETTTTGNNGASILKITTSKRAKVDGSGNPDYTLLDTLGKNVAEQISAVVWLDGTTLTNASVAAATLQSMAGTMNLQFATDVDLTPATNAELMSPQG